MAGGTLVSPKALPWLGRRWCSCWRRERSAMPGSRRGVRLPSERSQNSRDCWSQEESSPGPNPACLPGKEPEDPILAVKDFGYPYRTSAIHSVLILVIGRPRETARVVEKRVPVY